MIRLLLFLVTLALPAQGEVVVAGLSQNRVAITANFDGSEILIFGAVKRQAPPPDTEPLQVVITVAGPSQPIVVRRKERRFGIWVNVDAVTVDRAPSFYSIATTAPFSDVISAAEDLRYRISVPQMIRSIRAPDNISDAAAFSQALIRIRANSGQYQLNPETVTLDQDTLFQTSVALPANLTEGIYATRIFLTRGGKVIDLFETEINVQKVGIERWLFALAHERPLIYGLLSLFIAIVAGWGASAIFRYLRP